MYSFKYLGAEFNSAGSRRPLSRLACMTFCSADLDLHSVTLMYELDLLWKCTVTPSRLSQVRAGTWQRHT